MAAMTLSFLTRRMESVLAAVAVVHVVLVLPSHLLVIGKILIFKFKNLSESFSIQTSI